MKQFVDDLAVAEAALARVAALAFGALDDAALVEVTARAEEVGRRLDAIRAASAAQVETRSRRELGEAGLSRRYGYSRASHLIEATARVSSADARRRIQVGTSVGERMSETGVPLPPLFPVVAEALRAGELGMDAASHIVRQLGLAAGSCTVDDLDAAERSLVEQGRVSAADLIGDQSRIWRDHLDTEGAAPRSERQHAARRFSLGRERDDGMTPFSGLADPVAAGVLRAGFGAFRRKPKMVEEGSVDDVLPDERTHEQRDFDTLMGLVGAGLRCDDTFTPGGRASVVATVSLRDLHDGVGIGWIDDVRDSVAIGMIDELACDAGYEIAITNDCGAIVSLTSRRRFFTRRQRRAIAARDGGCVFPNCPAPTSWCDAHHVVEDQDGGRTDVSNGVLLCSEHHHYLHGSRYEMKMIRGRPHLLAPPEMDPSHHWRPVGKARLEQQAMLRSHPDPVAESTATCASAPARASASASASARMPDSSAPRRRAKVADRLRRCGWRVEENAVVWDTADPGP